MDFPFPSQIDFRTSILALDAEYGLREVPSYSVEATRNGMGRSSASGLSSLPRLMPLRAPYLQRQAAERTRFGAHMGLTHYQGVRAMTDPSLATEVRAFFEQYSEAFASFDGKEVAALYYEPTVTMRGDGSIHCLRSHEDLVAFFQGVIDTYRKDGYADSNIKNFDVLPIGDLSALATMDWEMLRQDGSLIRRWRQSYNVVRTPAGWRILVATFHVARAAA